MSSLKTSVRINDSDENTPLIANEDGVSHSFHEDESGRSPVPTFTKSIRSLLFAHWLNILLLFVPLSFISHFAGWGSTSDFVISFLAIIPLSGLLGDATEQVALKVGQTLGGLLNATFGNAVEAIVGIIALSQGQLRIVQTSMLGSILSNVLLVLGCAFLAAGIKFRESTFQATAAQTSASLMTLACVGLVVPAAYSATQPPNSDNIATAAALLANNDGHQDTYFGILVISRATAIVLFLVYVLYLFFQLKTHAYLFEAGNEGDDAEDEAKMSLPAAVGCLVTVTVVTAFCADYLVDSIDEFAQQRGIPKAFIGLILLPIVGNAAEHVTSIMVAVRGKMELAIGVAVGSSIQIAVGVIPLMVLIGWGMGQELTLVFGNFETTILVFAVLLVSLLVQDGKSNYMEGALLIALYIIIGVSYWES